MTQPAFAEVANAKKRTLIDWEKDVSSPTAVQLAALVQAGVDGLYVLTGVRAASWSVVSQLRAATELAQQVPGSKDDQADIQDMLFQQMRALSPTPRQAALLALFDQADEAGKKLIEATAAMAAKSSAG